MSAKFNWRELIGSYDERRDIVIPGDFDASLSFCIEHFLDIANESITSHGHFAVALSGGSTPNSIFKRLALPEYQSRLDWSCVWLFWSDERSVSPEHSDSNYGMAMTSGLAALPIPPENIFRMHAEENIEENAKAYEALLRTKLSSQSFDLVMLGMGEDGHTASLFPQTHGLHVEDRLVIANYIPQKHTWRMTLTFDCINGARNIALYIFGKNKAETVKKVLTSSYNPDLLPAQRIGLSIHKALWILDKDASRALLN